MTLPTIKRLGFAITATVQYAREEDAETAVQLFNNTKLNGRTIEVCLRNVVDASPPGTPTINTDPLRSVTDYVQHLARTMGADFNLVLEQLSTEVKGSAVSAADAGFDMKPVLDVLMRDAFGEMKNVLDAEQGPEGVFAVQRDPFDVLRNHRAICEKIEKLYRDGNLSAIPLTEQSFQQQCLRDVVECHTVWRAMTNDSTTPVADMERLLANVRQKSEKKLDDAVLANADQAVEATAECAAMTAALAQIEAAEESMILAQRILTTRGEPYPDFDRVFCEKLRDLSKPLNDFAEGILKANEDIVRVSEMRQSLGSSLKSVLDVGVKAFLKAYREKVLERDGRRGHFRNWLLRLCVHGRSYYEHVLVRYVAELDKSHQALVRAEEDASQVNNPRRSHRGASEKMILLEDIADLGKRVDLANRAKEQLTAIIQECGGEEQARLVHHEADGRIRCLEAAPADPFNPVTHFGDDENDVAHVLRQRLALEELTSESNLSEANPSEANYSETNFSEVISTEGGRNYYVDDHHINAGTAIVGRKIHIDDAVDAEEYNIVAGGH